MITSSTRMLATLVVVLSMSCVALSSCAPQPSATPASSPAAALAPTVPPTVPSTSVPFPALTLNPGDHHFRMDGEPSFLFSRNIAGYQQTHYETFLDWSQTGGSRLVRIQLDSLGMGYTSSGGVDNAWAERWERIFDRAASDGLYILPVFSGWFDWNAGNDYSTYTTWGSNPLNRANGGPVASPAELFQEGSTTQTMWMHWMQTLVERWQGRSNITAWEIFSEVNLASRPTESSGIDFVNTAAELIRATDPSRPVTASIADTGTWPDFYRNASIDFICIHPYPPSAQLDRTILGEVRQYLATYGRPVLIGESGLSAATPDSSDGKATVAENASRGIRHAIWAAIVSGAMNGRALYWEDSFGIYFPDLGTPWMQEYKGEELPAVRFVHRVDFSGFRPLTSTSSSAIWGAAVGNEKMVLGWYRDASCEPPDWNLQTIPAGQTVTITVPGTNADWQVDFYDTKTGTTIIGSASVIRQGSSLAVTLPDFKDDVAFKMTAWAGTATVPSAGTGTTDAIAGNWAGMISDSAGTFSTPVELSIQPNCEPGRVCGTYSAPQLPCSGALFLQEVAGDTLVFVEQDVTGAASCTSGGYEYLEPLADGTLAYRFAFTQDSAVASSGILARP